MEELKVTYEWYTPGERFRRFWDTARGETQKIAIDNVKKVIKRRIRHECYKVIEIKFEKGGLKKLLLRFSRLEIIS